MKMMMMMMMMMTTIIINNVFNLFYLVKVVISSCRNFKTIYVHFSRFFLYVFFFGGGGLK